MGQKANTGISLVAIIAVIVLYSIKFTGKQELVYIDTNILFSKYKGMKDAQKAFDKQAVIWDANVDSVLVGFEAEIKAYEKDRLGMTPKEKEFKEELLRNKQAQVGHYQEAMQRKKKDEEQTRTQSVINDVNDFISEYGKNHNYRIILGAAGKGNILYADDALDITDDVLQGLNEQYKK